MSRILAASHSTACTASPSTLRGSATYKLLTRRMIRLNGLSPNAAPRQVLCLYPVDHSSMTYLLHYPSIIEQSSQPAPYLYLLAFRTLLECSRQVQPQSLAISHVGYPNHYHHLGPDGTAAETTYHLHHPRYVCRLTPPMIL